MDFHKKKKQHRTEDTAVALGREKAEGASLIKFTKEKT